MLIAEDLLLLAYDDTTGKPDAWLTHLEHRVAGALLLELALAGRVDVAGPGTTTSAGSAAKPGTVVVLDPSPTGHPVLDGALDVVGRQPRKPENLVAPLAKGVTEALLSGLADRRILRRQEGRFLGIFPTTSWPATDSSHETALRAECADVLLGHRAPSPTTAALLSLTHGTSLVKTLVPAEHRKQAEARVKELSEGSWANTAVTRSVEAVNAAVMVAVMLPLTTATIISS
ncbi:GOLPH3/VPS74 family protein [Isoptericola jiangsuensis]|uniref:GOLPH3/VPS74 family protein n=1 Tax=Isoptericola jiangsuensis TaxID=548579 RepID=UPI003AAC2264